MPLFWLAVAIVAAGAFVWKKAATMEAAQQAEKNTLDDIFVRVAASRGVDVDLLRAIAQVESSMDPGAIRWEPPRDVSAGLMQILCVPPEGTNKGEDFVCQNKLRIPGWPTTFNALLTDVEMNVDIAAQILAENIRGYGFLRGVAMYNDYAARHSAPNGPFPNDRYAKKVLFIFNQLKGIAA